MRALKLGKGLDLPLDVATRTTAIVGQRGTGKTSTAVVLVEEATAAGAQVAVVDPTGAWYGLRSSADGKGAGLEVIVFGGHHADVPLEPTAGGFIARLVIEQGLSVVLDLELMTKGKQVQFVAEFAEELYHRNRTALTLVVDEAHRFTPQQLRDPGGFGARCLGAVTDVVTMGRRKGLGAVLISQRPAKINKDVFEQAEVMVVHRLMGPNDRKAIAGWLDEAIGTKEGVASVQELAAQHAMVWAPAFGVYGDFAIRAKRTFDSSATPEIGTKVMEPKGRADVDLAAIEQAMADTIERAKADDPKALRARIRVLEQEIADRPDRVVTETQIVEREVPVFDETVVAGITNTIEDARVDVGAALAKLAQIDEFVSEQVEEIRRIAGTQPSVPQPRPDRASAPPIPLDPPVERQRPVLRDSRPGGSAVGDGDGPALKAGARRMLAAVAGLHPMVLSRSQVGTLAKVKKSGGTYSTYLSVLKQHGLLVENGEGISITPEGFAALGTEPPAPATPDELLAMWRDRLKAGARVMLDVLVQNRHVWFTREHLAQEAGLAASGGTFSTYLSQLRSAGLIDEQDGQVSAGAVLFTGVQPNERT